MTRRRVIEATPLDPDELMLDPAAGLTLDGSESLLLETDQPPAEEVALAEIEELQAGFKARAQREDQRFEDATDSEFWVALCFQTRAQKDEFLRKAGWLEIGEKYLDGMLVALKLGISLDSRVPPLPHHNIDRRLLALTECPREGR